MYLRDVVIDLEKYQATCSRAERQLAVIAQRNCWCVCDLFVNLIRRQLDTSSIAKIIIDLDRELVVADRNLCKVLISIIRLPWPCRLGDYVRKDKLEKKEFFLRIIRDSIGWLCEVYGWEKSSVEAAYLRALEMGLVHQGFLVQGKSWPARDKKTRVKISYDVDLDWCRLYAVFYRKRQEIARALIIDQPPTDVPLLGMTPAVRWESDVSVVFRFMDGRIVRCRLTEPSEGNVAVRVTQLRPMTKLVKKMK
jgi:hypothetical protein